MPLHLPLGLEKADEGIDNLETDSLQRAASFSFEGHPVSHGRRSPITAVVTALQNTSGTWNSIRSRLSRLVVHRNIAGGV